jgi:hypothetical protein
MVPEERFAPPLPMYPVLLPIFNQQCRAFIDQVGLANMGRPLCLWGYGCCVAAWRARARWTYRPD